VNTYTALQHNIKPTQYNNTSSAAAAVIADNMIDYRPLAGVKAGCVHLCRVAGDPVWQVTPCSFEIEFH